MTRPPRFCIAGSRCSVGVMAVWNGEIHHQSSAKILEVLRFGFSYLSRLVPGSAGSGMLRKVRPSDLMLLPTY